MDDVSTVDGVFRSPTTVAEDTSPFRPFGRQDAYRPSSRVGLDFRLRPKADMAAGATDVRFGGKADVGEGKAAKHKRLRWSTAMGPIRPLRHDGPTNDRQRS